MSDAQQADRPPSPEAWNWLQGLRSFAAERRAARPQQPVRPAAEARAERSILADHFASWLGDADVWRAARRDWAAAGGRDPEPALVLTTSAVGLLAAADVFRIGDEEGLAREDTRCGWLPPRLAVVTELEYRLWCIRRPDEEHRLHLNHWNWLKTRLPQNREADFAHHPLAAGECHWLHRTGTAGGGAADRRDSSLWRWSGREATLVEATVRERGVHRLGGPQAGMADR